MRDYFFADYCGGWIRKLDPAAGNSVVSFASGISSPVDLKVSDDGSLDYLARGTGAATGVVYRIQYGAVTPTITAHPESRTVTTGKPVTFSVRASGPPPLRYQWQRNGANITGATARDYTIASVGAADQGAGFRAVVRNDFGNVLSNAAVLTVTANRAPTAAMSQPATGALYSAGNVIAYTGTATDPEDGTLPPSAFTWKVDFHHDTHLHPFVPPTTGSRTGSFSIPRTGETSANVWYRIHLTVRDSGGLTRSIARDILPRKVRVTLASSPAGLQLKLDGQPVATPMSFDGVVGITRTLEAATPQTSGGVTYGFASWSDGGAARHDIATPAANTTYLATYGASGGSTGTGLSATYFNNVDFTGTAVSRIDSTVNFSWGSGSPATTIGPDTFSARWVGQVEAQFTDTYTFYTRSDDGVRLWVNGRALVNDWTNHGVTENSGRISLVAGRRYDIRMEFYENGGAATARLLWSSASTPKAVVPSTRLYSQAIRINFQTGSAPVPAGYLPDAGLAFASRGNGHTYGWKANNTAQMRDRNASNSPDQRYDTLAYMRRPGNPDATWEIALSNGSYRVRIVAGDPSYFDTTIRIAAEGVLTVSGTTTSAQRWLDATSTVTVADGRLTIHNAAGAAVNEICFVEIAPR